MSRARSTCQGTAGVVALVDNQTTLTLRRGASTSSRAHRLRGSSQVRDVVGFGTTANTYAGTRVRPGRRATRRRPRDRPRTRTRSTTAPTSRCFKPALAGRGRSTSRSTSGPRRSHEIQGTTTSSPFVNQIATVERRRHRDVPDRRRRRLRAADRRLGRRNRRRAHRIGRPVHLLPGHRRQSGDRGLASALRVRGLVSEFNGLTEITVNERRRCRRPRRRGSTAYSDRRCVANHRRGSGDDRVDAVRPDRHVHRQQHLHHQSVRRSRSRLRHDATAQPDRRWSYPALPPRPWPP